MSSNASFKKRQEDAAKKQNGQMAPDVDQDGKMINPHNPDFITRVPWYLGESGPTLKHHQVQKHDRELTLSEADRLIESKLQAQAKLKQQTNRVVYRKGACKNCGALTHNEKDCVERPRSTKKSAWKTGLDIAPDELVLKLEEHGKVSYSAKRDQWQGYDAGEYKTVVERYNRIEEERQKQQLEEKIRRKQKREEMKRLKKQRKEEKKVAKLHKKLGIITSEKDGDKDSTKNEVKNQISNSRRVHFKQNHKKTKRIHGENDDDSDKDKTTESSDEHPSDDVDDDSDNDSDDTGSDNSDSDSDSDSDTDYDSDNDSDDGDDEGHVDITKEFLEKDENARDFQARQARQGGVMGNELKMTARNLRLREDTPKYLRNLNLDSAHYDPKSRSMRANPFPHENPENLPFAGDNFVRYSGDAIKLASTQVLCWEMQGPNADVINGIDVISNPSQAELLHKKITEEKKVEAVEKKQAIYDKYGVKKEDIQSLDPRIRLGQTEAYSEFSWDGRIIKGSGKIIPKSKYDEDIYINNHTSVWGSYYNKFRQCWGYACCHSLLKNAYCTGDAGRLANDAANISTMDPNQMRQMLENRTNLTKKQATSTILKRSDLYGDVDTIRNTDLSLDSTKLQQAITREAETSKKEGGAGGGGGSITGSSSSSSNGGVNDDRTRAYNSMKSIDVGLEDMEAYRLKRQRKEDPMAMIEPGKEARVIGINSN